MIFYTGTIVILIYILGIKYILNAMFIFLDLFTNRKLFTENYPASKALDSTVLLSQFQILDHSDSYTSILFLHNY